MLMLAVKPELEGGKSTVIAKAAWRQPAVCATRLVGRGAKAPAELNSNKQDSSFIMVQQHSMYPIESFHGQGHVNDNDAALAAVT